MTLRESVWFTTLQAPVAKVLNMLYTCDMFGSSQCLTAYFTFATGACRPEEVPQGQKVTPNK